MHTLILALLSAMAGPACRAAQVHVGPNGVAMPPLLNGLAYRATDDAGLVFETSGATLGADGVITFALQGPGAPDATVTARLTRLPRGFALDWTIRYTGPQRSWNGWTSGFHFDFGLPVTGAKTEAVTKWVRPTGAHPWEVPGDTPYPDTECQLRQVLFGDQALVMVSSSYDGDWIYGNNPDRACFARFGLPKETPCELTARMAFLQVPAAELSPAQLAAEAAGRPVALTIHTGRLANLFAPDETINVQYVVSNVTDQPQASTLELQAWSYQGEQLLAQSVNFPLPPRGTQTAALRLSPPQRGVIFLAFRLSWNDGETLYRTTLGVLPERKATGTIPESPFGMASVIAAPHLYPDQFPLPLVLDLMERIGVRWIRGGWIPFKDQPSEEDDRQTRQRCDWLTQHGILPHVQLGSSLPQPEELEAFKQRLAATLERYQWVSPYIEIGNELNFSVSGTEYVAKMLRPIHEVMRRVFPEGKLLSMGLGGVGQEWLGEFVQAGGMDLIDVLSVHPGSFPRAPEFWEGWRGWVFRSQMMDAMKAAREHGGKEVWITEAYAPTPPGRSGLDLRTAADYLVRTYISSLAIGVRVIEWYQFQDGVWFARRQKPDDVEYNFGIVYADLTPKPAYVAYGAMTEQLEGARFVARLDLGADDLYGARFDTHGTPLDVLWSYREKHEVDLPWWPPEKYQNDSRRPAEPWVERWQAPVTVELPVAPGINTVTVTDIMGNARQIPAADGKVSLRLTGSPIYVQGLGHLPRLPQFWEDIP